MADSHLPSSTTDRLRSTVLLRGLPTAFLKGRQEGGRTQREILTKTAAPFGGLTSTVTGIVIFHVSRRALLEFPSTTSAAAMIAYHADKPLVLPGYTQELQVLAADQVIDPMKLNGREASAAVVLRTVDGCLRYLIRTIEQNHARENKLRRQKQRQQHRAIMRRVFTKSIRDGFRRDVCWDYVRTNGQCPRAKCPFAHKTCPLHLIPASLRDFRAFENFPTTHREGCPEKSRVNAALTALAHDCWLHDSVAVVLDGPGCKSSRALLCGHASTAGATKPRKIFVPNTCTATFVAIESTGICVPYLGSLRAFIDESAAKRPGQFSLIYADYCCSLHSGRYDVEKSPVQDLHAIFRGGVLVPTKAIVAVTLAKLDAAKRAAVSARTGNEDDDDARLLALMVLLSKRSGRVCTLEHHFDFKSTFTSIFSISAPVDTLGNHWQSPNVTVLWWSE